METKIYSVDEIKNLFLQELINKVDGRISKVSDHSVLNGVAYGFAKVFQKSMKDVALLESELFPEYAFGEYLDKIAQRYGIVGRLGAAGSSVYVKLVAAPGTLYLASSCSFVSSEGATFSLEENFEVGNNGWGYAHLKSDSTGLNTNVGIGSISKITNAPSGHLYVVNELPAVGGLDQESDSSFLQRIIQNFNNFSFETLDKLTSVFQKINPLVLEVRKVGTNTLSQVILSIITSNGVQLTSSELNTLTDRCLPYLSLQDLSVTNSLPGSYNPIVLQNIEVIPVDLDFRIQLESYINVDDFRVSCQEALSDYLDFTKKKIEKVEWEDLFAIIKTQTGVKSVPEEYFYCGNNLTWAMSPHHFDIQIPSEKIARLRTFVVRDLSGTVIFDNDNELIPYYYGEGYTNVFDQINNFI